MRENINHIKIIIFLIGFILIFGNLALTPCTVAVISGKITSDGCPLLWKNRDTSHPNNKVVFVKGEKYSFMGVVNSEDKEATSVWQGINSKGFAIINSASSDLLVRTNTSKDNGRIMRQALGICVSVKDFEALLQRTVGKRRVAANYGVIDAYGNACFFETSRFTHTKFDANDPETAPDGYILRTNFAFSSPREKMGGGYIRFERISHIFEKAAEEKRLNTSFILQEAARDLVNEKLHSEPLSMDPDPDSSSPVYVRTNDTINRITTISAAVFHGAPNPKKAYLATLWILLGQPVCSVALPLWVYGQHIPDVLGGPKTAPMHDLSKKLISYLYHDQRGNMKQYLNLTRFLNYKENGFLPILYSIENETIFKTKQNLEEWSKNKPTPNEVKSFMEQTAQKAYQKLRDSFADILKGSSLSK